MTDISSYHFSLFNAFRANRHISQRTWLEGSGSKGIRGSGAPGAPGLRGSEALGLRIPGLRGSGALGLWGYKSIKLRS